MFRWSGSEETHSALFGSLVLTISRVQGINCELGRSEVALLPFTSGSDARPDLDTSPTLSIIRRPHVHLPVCAQDAACRPLRSGSRQRKAERATSHGKALRGRGRGEPGKAKTACLRAGD